MDTPIFTLSIHVFRLNDGARYNPATNTWTAIPSTLANAPAERFRHTAIWSGSQMIVWGGTGVSGYLDDGARYDPATNTWTAIPNTLSNNPTARYGHTAVWTGTEMILWSGYGETGPGTLVFVPLQNGARYNPAANGGTGSWASLDTATGNGPLYGTTGHTAVWTGTEMIIFGGSYNTAIYLGGSRYDPAANHWTTVNDGSPNFPRTDHTAVWTGSEMLVWGGHYFESGYHYLSDLWRYNPVQDSWATMPDIGTPRQRYGHAAVWTGIEMVVWGGDGPSGLLNTGGRLRPSKVAPGSIATLQLADSSVTADKIALGAVGSGQLAPTLTIGGTFTAGGFTGDGSGLTGLDAGRVTAGTLGDLRLSPNVALLDRATQTFIGTNIFNGTVKTLGGLIIELRTSDPPAPVAGQMWLRTDL